ncbi:transposase [Halobacterium salinarum]|uniref:transposase n=1 Tax=Halobacterium salinarum TaxID=2242 RepID=UPI0025547F03|nr:transposase [Halobacterium salinarum]MDL0138980.1 transposase [Halobacterium salinarum]
MSDLPSVDDLDLDPAYNTLEQQADDIIEYGTEWPELATQLDVSKYRSQDPYPAWHAETNDFDPVFLAALWAKTEDKSITGIADRLEDNPEIATALGFNPDDIPHGDTFARAWRNRLNDEDSDVDLQTIIETTAKTIDKLATERGSPIGGHTGLQADETDGSSTRAGQRLLREKTREVLDQMSDVVFPELNLPRPEHAIYDEEDLLELMTVMGMEGDAANDGATINSDRLAAQKDIDIDDPFYVDGPTGETLLEAIHDLTIKRITDMVNRSAERALKRIKPYAEFPEPVFLAIDITYVAYYGGRDGLEWVTGTPDHKDYSWCHKFATATLVGDGVHLTVGMLPVGNEDHVDNDAYPGDDEYTVIHGDVVRDLLEIVPDSVTPRCVYADRGFASTDAIAAFEENNLKYLMPAPRNDRTKRWLRRNVDMERGILAVKKDWGVRGKVKHGSSNHRKTTNLVGLPGDPNDEQYGYGEVPDDDEEEVDEEDQSAVPFYTNLHVSDETALDRRQAKEKVEEYNQRGGIETSYKKIKEFAAWTTSRKFEPRLFHFGFAVLLYNAWLMVDFLVQVGLDVEVRSKPRITAQRFIKFIDRNLVGLI